MTDNRAVMTELSGGVETIGFDTLTPSEPSVFAGVSGDEYGLSGILYLY